MSEPGAESPVRVSSPGRAVPWRTIFASIAAVVGTGLALLAVLALRHILTLLLVAGFFAVILSPAVDWTSKHLRVRRTVAVLLVFVVSLGAVSGMIYVFVRPLVDQAQEFSDKFPGYVDDAQHGRGTIGHLVKKYKLDDYVKRNQTRLKQGVSNAGKPALKIASTVASTLFALVTILVLTILILVEAPDMLRGGLNALSPPRQERVRRVAADCAKSVTGYMAGNLLISVIAGAVTFVTLLILGVPFRGALAVWVAFADLIPLVGATLGAIPTIGVAFLHSVPAGIIVVIVYIVYQQFENHVLQVTIMARTVSLNPLLVLVSVLVGVELFGFLGALLAIPAGGIIQVIARDIYDHRRGEIKAEPTVGTDEIPVSELSDD